MIMSIGARLQLSVFRLELWKVIPPLAVVDISFTNADKRETFDIEHDKGRWAF